VAVPEGTSISTAAAWPELRYDEWKDTCATLHLWTQIVGKIRLVCTPWINHSWHATLYPTVRGLTTSSIPYDRSSFRIDFDFIDHELRIERDDGRRALVGLHARSVADFHADVMARLAALDLDVRIHELPNEIADPIPFPEDLVHASYDADSAHRFWRVLASAARVFTDFRGEFRGKASPAHFFWGSFDLAVTRFSGRPAPQHPGGVLHLPDWVCREAYSHEVSSAGFWPGGEAHPHAVFYSYAYPVPSGMSERSVRPEGAVWSPELGEFVLPYATMRGTVDPDATLMAFLQSTYEAAADLAGWNREQLEWGPEGRPTLRR
jgi:Family of unknown function (DUF5996)